MGRWGDGEMGRWGVIIKNCYKYDQRYICVLSFSEIAIALSCYSQKVVEI
ncbi:hypothetical protein [Moorena producens]